MAYEFLSDEWVEEARRIRGEYADRAATSPVAFRMNVVVTDLPSGRDRLELHLDATAGELDLELGALADPDLTITLAYDTARGLFVGGDAQEALAAFLGGRIKVDGDISKLLGLQANPTAFDPVVGEVISRLRAATA